jgi:hypothetical protein
MNVNSNELNRFEKWIMTAPKWILFLFVGVCFGLIGFGLGAADSVAVFILNLSKGGF